MAQDRRMTSLSTGVVVAEDQEILRRSDIEAYDHRQSTYLGEGSEAKVYRSTQARSGKVFAVKFINRSTSPSGRLDPNPREVRILTALGFCVRIVQFLGFKHDPREFYNAIFIEFCNGGALDEYTGVGGRSRPDGRPASEAFVWHVFRQIAEGLAFLHHGLQPTLLSAAARNRGATYIHGDLKDGNVLLLLAPQPERTFPDLKLADFGLAYEAGHPLRDRLGTMGFQPPDLDLQPSDDIYALGVVIHELVHGSTPVEMYYAEHGQEITHEMRRPDNWNALMQQVRPIHVGLNKTLHDSDPLMFLPNYSEHLNYWMMRCLELRLEGSNPEEIRATTIELFDEMRKYADKAVAAVSHKPFKVTAAERQEVDDLYKMYLPDAGTTGTGPYSDDDDNDDNWGGGHGENAPQPPPRQDDLDNQKNTSTHQSGDVNQDRTRSGKRPSRAEEETEERPSKRQRTDATASSTAAQRGSHSARHDASLSFSDIPDHERTQRDAGVNRTGTTLEREGAAQPEDGGHPEGVEQPEDALNAEDAAEDRRQNRKRTSSEAESEVAPERPTKKPHEGTKGGKKGRKDKGQGAATQPRRPRGTLRVAPATTRLLAGIDQSNVVGDDNRTLVESRALRKRGTDKKVVGTEKK